MKEKTKFIISVVLFASLAIVSCGNKSSEISSASNHQSSSDSIKASISEEQSSESASSSSESSSSEEQTTCKDDLHDYVRYIPVDNGHQKACETCNALIGEKENHNYFTDTIKYCPSCGYYDKEMNPYFLPDIFNVTVRTADGDTQRSILRNTYMYDGGIFTLSSPSNAHSSYADFSVEGAKFYYDDQIDDGTKLFMLKETSDREKIGTCKTIYTYTLSLYNKITPGTFSYENGHISIDGQNISDWLDNHISFTQVTYKYLSIQHHADDYRVPVPGTNAVIVEVTCEDCGEFLYQEIIHND